MAEVHIIGETLCPWCHNELEVVKSAKSGYHYANCKSCNSHFRNIPVALVDMKGRQTSQVESKVEGSALERFLEEQRQKRENPQDVLDRFLRKHSDKQWLKEHGLLD